MNYGILVLVLIAYFFFVMGRIISKSGDNGWKILIPIYGEYVFYRACDSDSVFWGIFVTNILGSFVSMLTGSSGTPIIILYIQLAISLIFQIFFVKNAAKAYGKTTGFAVGLFFLAPIFLSILAFDQSKYVGGTSYDKIPSETATWICPVCNKVNPVYRATCESCGRSK